jgi:hypothetical protein
MYLCTKCIDFASFNDFDIGFWNCSGSVVLFIYHSSTDTTSSVSYLDLHMEINTMCRFRTKLCDNGDFKFPIVIFAFICNNIPAVPSCVDTIFQSLRFLLGFP